jgi:hypothetical protein
MNSANQPGINKEQFLKVRKKTNLAHIINLKYQFQG